MKKFQFRLEPVLKHRECCEETAALEQVRVQEEYQQNCDVLRDTREKMSKAVQCDQAVDYFDLINMQTYCSYMSEEIVKREAAVHVSSQKLADCRKKLIRAMQERSVMDKLKENQLQCYNQQVLAYVQKENDEIATQQFMRRNK